MNDIKSLLKSILESDNIEDIKSFAAEALEYASVDPKEEAAELDREEQELVARLEAAGLYN